MKILILAKFLRKDGATTHMFTLANGLTENGYEVHIMSGGPPNDRRSKELFNNFFKGNIRHHLIGFPNYAKFDFLSKVKQLITYIALIPIGIYKIRKINPDVIHVHYPVTSYMAWLYSKLFNKKFVTTYHIKGIPKQILHKKANKSIAISSEMVIELKERWGYRDDEISLVFNGVDDKIYNRNISEENKKVIKERLNIPLDKKIIGFVGTYEYKKGIDILLESCSKIDLNDFHIVLLGDGDKVWVDNLINKFQLRYNVSTFDFQEPLEFYSIFDIFVLPSRNEGFPLVALEAMMMGVATVRSNVSGAYDMIDDNLTGCIFESENTNELTKKIELLLYNDEFRTSIAIKGKENVLKKFTQKIMVENTIKVYESLR